MSYFVHVAFDMTNQDSEAYRAIEEALNTMGLYSTIEGSSKKTLTLPANTFAGKFTGESAGKIRDDLCTKIQDAFRAHNIHGNIFVSVGGDWAWGMRSP